ncbi:predicted protein [Aspergillus terreus NIH2624]|uniref:Uncharacterized protein n=1 Tax=Aspergillus terreus (strain NIH 2624 / FGSC A1156) TaxID=341663 RepID=Q0C8Q6_ASPTN|nr:uncharacterized protein ATEG_09928 [Aspergillus terreus NIH2624]EAU30119.1 predicted protein [Aspergillus terreus NIH2624]
MTPAISKVQAAVQTSPAVDSRVLCNSTRAESESQEPSAVVQQRQHREPFLAFAVGMIALGTTVWHTRENDHIPPLLSTETFVGNAALLAFMAVAWDRMVIFPSRYSHYGLPMLAWGSPALLYVTYILCLAGYVCWYDTRATHPLATYIMVLQLGLWVVVTVGWTVSTMFCSLLDDDMDGHEEPGRA